MRPSVLSTSAQQIYDDETEINSEFAADERASVIYSIFAREREPRPLDVFLTLRVMLKDCCQLYQSLRSNENPLDPRCQSVVYDSARAVERSFQQ